MPYKHVKYSDNSNLLHLTVTVGKLDYFWMIFKSVFKKGVFKKMHRTMKFSISQGKSMKCAQTEDW